MDDVKGPDTSKELERLVQTYQTQLRRLCCMILKDVHLAEDAVQETFLKAYLGMNRFRQESSEKTWLTRIAVNTCRDLLRRRISAAFVLSRFRRPFFQPWMRRSAARPPLISQAERINAAVSGSLLLFCVIPTPFRPFPSVNTGAAVPRSSNTPCLKARSFWRT